MSFQTDTDRTWTQLQKWLGMDVITIPSTTDDVIELASAVKDSWAENGRRLLVTAEQRMHNITHELTRLQHSGGDQEVMAKAFVDELGHRPSKQVRTHSSYNEVLKKMRQAVPTSSTTLLSS